MDLQSEGKSFLANLPTQGKMALALGSLMLLVLTGSISFLVAQGESATARAAVTHTHEVIENLYELTLTVADKESGIRAYVITSEPEFLEPYHIATRRYAEILNRLKHLVRDNPAQLILLNKLDEEMQIWQKDFAVPVIGWIGDGSGRTSAVEMVDKGDDKIRVDNMRDILDEMSDAEQVLLTERLNYREKYDRIGLILNWCLIAASLFLGGLAMTTSQRLITRPLRNITDLMTRLAEKDHSIEVPNTERKDEIGLLARALLVFKKTAIDTENHTWVKTQVAQLSAALQGTTTHIQFGDVLMSQLTPLLGAPLAVFYQTQDDGSLLLISSYGFRERRGISRSYLMGEGLVGQCARTGQTMLVNELPNDYIRVHSSLGEAPPRSLMLVPLVTRGEVLGVLEFGTLSAFSDMQQRLLEELMPILALSLENLSRSVKTQQLLEETQAQAEELMTSEESLKAQQEELRVTNEQIEQQSRRLRASEEELRVQSEELRVSNDELRLKTETLNHQKDLLEQLHRDTLQKAEELEQASRYKSEFLANMSHELRTPLNSMLILSKSLADNEEGNLDADQKEAAGIINDSGKNLLRLINDILDLSKVEAGKMDVHVEPVELSAFKGGVERNFRHVAREKKLQFSIEVEPGMPESIEQDGSKIGQVVTNLLSNAFKFTAEGGITLQIGRPVEGEVVAGLEPLRTVAFRVTDTGIGIPEAKLQRVFEAFEQVDGTTSRKYGGTGLGLSISRKLAQLLGGDIVIRSTEGVGTTFTLLLPESLKKSEAETPVIARAKPAVKPVAVPVAAVPDFIAGLSDPPPQAGKPLILVIEDDPNFAKILADTIRKRGCEVITANDGEAGCAAAEKYNPTGIILDVSLPGMDGWSVMEQLKANPKTRHIPVHFMSALDESLRGLGMGAVGYLVKPVSKEAINEAFDKVLHFSAGAPRRLLLVDDDHGSRVAVHTLIDLPDVEIIEAVTGAAGLAALQNQTFDCIILDLMLPDMDGLGFLKEATRNGPLPPVVIYSAKSLTPEETLKLRQYTDSIVVKSARSPERLLDEVTLFLHSIRDAHTSAVKVERESASDLSGKTALIVDDDMRNVFALSRALRTRGLNVVMAEDGYKALTQLEQNKLINIVLMDIMMPGMDGYATMREIRKRPEWQKLPMIAVSAKAMRGDREKCIEAGANDYLAKPIDVDKLISMMRVLI